MKITFNGDPITLVGNPLNVGDDAPNFLVVDNTLKNVTLKDTSGKRIFVVVPSIDTSVCDMEVRKFNEKAASLDDVTTIIFPFPLIFFFVTSRNVSTITFDFC